MAGLFGSTKTNAEKRKAFRESLESEELTRLPGAFNPLTARLIQDIGGFEGVYISGAVLANDLGLPDIGLTTLTEVSQRRSEEHTSELQSRFDLVCRLLLEKKTNQ